MAAGTQHIIPKTQFTLYTDEESDSSPSVCVRIPIVSGPINDMLDDNHEDNLSETSNNTLWRVVTYNNKCSLHPTLPRFPVTTHLVVFAVSLRLPSITISQ